MQEPLIPVPNENNEYSLNRIMVAPDGVPFLRIEGNQLVLCNRAGHGAVSPDSVDLWHSYRQVLMDILSGSITNETALRNMFSLHERGYLHSFGVIREEGGQVFFNFIIEGDGHETSLIE